MENLGIKPKTADHDYHQTSLALSVCARRHDGRQKAMTLFHVSSRPMEVWTAMRASIYQTTDVGGLG